MIELFPPRLMSNEKEEGEIEGAINVHPHNTKYSRGSGGHSGGNEVFLKLIFLNTSKRGTGSFQYDLIF